MTFQGTTSEERRCIFLQTDSSRPVEYTLHQDLETVDSSPQNGHRYQRVHTS